MRLVKVLALSTLVLSLAHCGMFKPGSPANGPSTTTALNGPAATTPESPSEIITGAAALQADSVPNGSLTLLDSNSLEQLSATPQSWLSKMLMHLAFANPQACPLPQSETCSGPIISMTYSNCSFGGVASAPLWTGGQTLTFGSATDCANFLTTINTPEIPVTGSFTKSFLSGTSRTTPAGRVASLNTTGTLLGWQSTTPVNLGINVAYGVTSRTIDISGLGVTIAAPHGASTSYIVTTPAPLVYTTSGAMTEITSGSIYVEDNTNKWAATTSNLSGLTYTAGCCYPTGGAIQTTLSGTKTGTEQIIFSSTCGQASITEAGGTPTTVTLRHCF